MKSLHFPFPFVRLTLPPLMPITCALMLGIVCQVQAIPLKACFFCLVVVSLLSLAVTSRSNFFSSLGIISCCSLSFLWANLTTQRMMDDLQDTQRRLLNRRLDLTGVIIDVQPLSKKMFTQAVTLSVTAAAFQGAHLALPSAYQATLYVRQPLVGSIGDILQYKNIACFQSSYNDKRALLYALNTWSLGHFFVHHTDYIITSQPSTRARWFAFWHKKRHELAGSIKEVLTPGAYALCSSLFLGERVSEVAESELLKKQFTYWGIAHYLARSGLHVAIIMIAWGFALRALCLPLLYKQLLLFLLLGLFTLLTGSSISFTRALMSYVIIRGFLLAYIPMQPLQTVTLACFLMLIYNPFFLFSLGFQLSFWLTAALAWLYELELGKARQTRVQGA